MMFRKELTIRESQEYAARYPYDGNAEQCLDRCRFGRAVYSCTRPTGHDGPHVATAPKGPIATWDDAAEGGPR
jgi:hypothetical protein